MYQDQQRDAREAREQDIRICETGYDIMLTIRELSNELIADEVVVAVINSRLTLPNCSALPQP